MRSPRRVSQIVLLAAILVLPATYDAWSDPPNRIQSEPAQRIVPGVPAQASHAHNIRLRIITVTPVEETDRRRLLKLEVERYYGKITTDSLNRAKQHETMRFTILFPASLDADIRPGDLLNYWLVGYTEMDGDNATDRHIPRNG